MKVLFAVSNENISTQIVKKYQKDYKEIISYKNMYYFNAIVKELQRDKSYDRIVISEDLEPFSNNNYDAIDKFLFEKLDNISDEATGINGEDIPIILLSTDRRTKSEPILVKLFGIGIYNALLGQDRNTANVCSLLNKPRSKKEAKIYYKIESDEVNYKSESEENVSEAEIKNILNHYRRLGKDEDRYIESFNNIAAQYNDAQLRIITKFLPLNVKAVLEEKSPKYQSVMTFGDSISTINEMKKQKEADGLKIGFLNNNNANKPVKPVIVPTAVKKVAMKKVTNTTNPIKPKEEIEENKTDEEFKEVEEQDVPQNFQDIDEFDDFKEIETTSEPEIEEPIQEKIQGLQEIYEPVKRGRGRPKKPVTESEKIADENVVKRGRGRPKKTVEETTNSNTEETLLPGFEEINDNIVIPGFEDEKEDSKEEILPGLEPFEPETTLPGFDDSENEDVLSNLDKIDDITTENQQNKTQENELTEKEDEFSNRNVVNYNEQASHQFSSINSRNDNMSGLLSKDKKIVAFIGTTKNGTSFLVNNVAKCLSSMGIKTAILDLTTNRNSYYIYTKNEEELRNIAYNSIRKLTEGTTSGITVDKNLDVYTALPGDSAPLDNIDKIMSTLAQNYSAVLLDCDFKTKAEYFEIAQEIYIVQTMDILTIQPMTAFLRDLKAKDILNPQKIRIVINKEMKVKGLTAKAIIGGLAYYNDPAMSFMTELFDKDNAKYCIIPFDESVCSRYLEGVMNCEIKINGYPKNFNTKLKELANMVYPLIENKNKQLGDYSGGSKFSDSMNNTLNQMKNKY